MQSSRLRHSVLAHTVAMPATVLAIALALPAPALSSAGPSLKAVPSAEQVTIGRALSLRAQLDNGGAPLADASLRLQVSTGSQRSFHTIARGVANAQGSFLFTGIKLERNSRLRVLSASSASSSAGSAPVAIIVNPAVEVYSRVIAPGQTYLAIRLHHDRSGPSAQSLVHWYIARHNSRHFRLVDVTASRELARGLTYANAVIASPWRHLRWRVCMNPPWAGQMGRPGTDRSCPTGDFTEGDHGH